MYELAKGRRKIMEVFGYPKTFIRIPLSSFSFYPSNLHPPPTLAWIEHASFPSSSSCPFQEFEFFWSPITAVGTYTAAHLRYLRHRPKKSPRTPARLFPPLFLPEFFLGGTNLTESMYIGSDDD